MRRVLLLSLLFVNFFVAYGFAAPVAPTDIKQPGTQPNEVSNLESPDKCDNCHGGYDSAVEPAFGWRGSAMGNAGRDPIFWATLAIAEQDFDGSGDLCVRCHSTGGWYGGRSEPTDGSGLAFSDSDGVDCDTCHSMTNPDNSEIPGEQFPPFVANDGGSPSEGYYGSGMLSLFGGGDKLGPYAETDAEAKHQFKQSKFHRSVDFCGSCHDVSNPVVGNLAPGHGAQATADPVVANGELGGTVDGKAAFNNPPYMYGVVERTFSEYKSSKLPETLVSDFHNLPEDLRVPGGAIEVAYQAALVAGTGGNYADGDQRFFSCQTCHMKPVTGFGANKRGIPFRNDLPHHDLTGGNNWIGDLIVYQNTNGQLRLGGGMSDVQLAATAAGKTRAEKALKEAGSLSVSGDTLKVTNLTAHKLISGYPEGRRMWLNIKWYDDVSLDPIREDGKYGPIGVFVANPANGADVEVESIIDLHDPNMKIYQAHYGITKEWADTLIAVKSENANLVVGYDRESGAPTYTLADVAAQAAGTSHESFHFVLNNTVVKDNRIPPYGMRYDDARKRNALPVPAEQYGNPDPGGIYNYFDQIDLLPPEGATYATIDLLYQGTSWEYIQFLNNANKGQNEFLGQEGVNMLEAWLNTGMVKPYVMATTTWGQTSCNITEDPEQTCDDGLDNDCDGLIDGDDTDCQTICTPTEDPEQTCDDGLDNDCDGLIDGDDTDCQTVCTPTEDPELSCTDGLDNDCDGLIDGDDTDCQGPMACGDYPDKNSCNMDLVCEWDRKAGICIDVPTTVDCSLFSTRNSCRDASCSWDNKAGVCM